MASTDLPLPRVVSMVICDLAHQEPGTRKFYLLGTFDTIRAKAVPATHMRPISVYLKVTNLHGSYRFGLRVLRAEDEHIVARVEGDKPFSSTDPLASHEFHFACPPGLPLPAFGLYRFRFVANDQPVHEVDFWVRQHGEGA